MSLSHRAKCLQRLAQEIGTEIAAEIAGDQTKGPTPEAPPTAADVLKTLAKPRIGEDERGERVWTRFDRRIFPALAQARPLLEGRYYGESDLGLAKAVPPQAPQDTDLIECLVEIVLDAIGTLGARSSELMVWRQLALQELGADAT
jgi:hypothetical protein